MQGREPPWAGLKHTGLEFEHVGGSFVFCTNTSAIITTNTEAMFTFPSHVSHRCCEPPAVTQSWPPLCTASSTGDAGLSPPLFQRPSPPRARPRAPGPALTVSRARLASRPLRRPRESLGRRPPCCSGLWVRSRVLASAPWGSSRMPGAVPVWAQGRAGGVLLQGRRLQRENTRFVCWIIRVHPSVRHEDVLFMWCNQQVTVIDVDKIKMHDDHRWV